MKTDSPITIVPQIKSSPQRLLIGQSIKMSLSDNTTIQLWQDFMPKRLEITSNLNNNLVSMSIYAEPLRAGDMDQTFDKWAAIEVSSFDSIPTGMYTITIPDSLYAVFKFKGMPSDFSIYYFIFAEWLPNSMYQLDNRPHFEILGEQYQNGSSESEEEIWIPIKPEI